MISEHNHTGFETATKNTMTTNLPSRFSIAALPCAGFTFVGGVDSSLMMTDLELSEKDLIRFWKRVKKGDCWQWTGSKNGDGYGMFCLCGQRKSLTNPQRAAHRVSWIIHNGPIPEGFLVCHHCDNPPCVNPSHLFLGTYTDNNRDMQLKGRNYIPPIGVFTGRRPPPAPGELNPFAKLTEDQVSQIKNLAKPGLFPEIGKRFGVHRTTIAKIYHGKRWTHITTEPKFGGQL